MGLEGRRVVAVAGCGGGWLLQQCDPAACTCVRRLIRGVLSAQQTMQARRAVAQIRGAHKCPCHLAHHWNRVLPMPSASVLQWCPGRVAQAHIGAAYRVAMGNGEGQYPVPLAVVDA